MYKSRPNDIKDDNDFFMNQNNMENNESQKEETEYSETSSEEDPLESLLEKQRVETMRRSFNNKIKIKEVSSRFSQNQISYIPGKIVNFY